MSKEPRNLAEQWQVTSYEDMPDALYIYTQPASFRSQARVTKVVKAQVVVDYDENGKLFGVEILLPEGTVV